MRFELLAIAFEIDGALTAHPNPGSRLQNLGRGCGAEFFGQFNPNHAVSCGQKNTLNLVTVGDRIAQELSHRRKRCLDFLPSHVVLSHVFPVDLSLSQLYPSKETDV
jgi:hypothetical protein